MFGSKKKAARDEAAKLQKCKEIAANLAERKGLAESDYNELDESAKRMADDITLLSENVQSTLDYAKNNARVVAGLCEGIEDYQQRIGSEQEQYHNIRKQIEGHAQSCMELVEQNKHFTTPSKKLSDMPEELRNQNSRYGKILEKMQGYGRQMGILALNAAIEAGRMGESGRQFVLSIEEVRNFSTQYSDAANCLLEEVRQSEETIAKMEETIHHLVGLLKENNVSTTKIMRGSQELQLYAEEALLYGETDKLVSIREELIGVHNLQEEVIKAEERNRMHLEDLLEEMDNHHKNEQEIMELLMPLMEQAQECV